MTNLSAAILRDNRLNPHEQAASIKGLMEIALEIGINQGWIRRT